MRSERLLQKDQQYATSTSIHSRFASNTDQASEPASATGLAHFRKPARVCELDRGASSELGATGACALGGLARLPPGNCAFDLRNDVGHGCQWCA